MNGPLTFRLVLWIFMTVVVLSLVVYTITHDGPAWKIGALSVMLVIGIVVSLSLYRAAKNR